MWTRPGSSSPNKGRWNRKTWRSACPGRRRRPNNREVVVTLDMWTDEDSPTPASAGIRPRQLTADQLARFEGYAAEMLAAMGMDLNTPGTRDTPRRFIR